MDKYYTSFPGPSTPNHLFIMSATSAGCTTTGEDYQCTSGKKFPQKTIFESLARQVTGRHCCQYQHRPLHHFHLHLLHLTLCQNKTWNYFINDTAWNYFLEWFNTPEGAAGVAGYDDFYHRAKTGDLPRFSFILPREGANATSGDGPD